MYQLFTDSNNVNTGHSFPPEFDYLKRILKTNVNIITDYYNSRVTSVSNSHFLVRLINTCSVPLNYPLEKYLDACNARCKFISRTFNITSDINYGKLHDGVFYGVGNKELIIYSDEVFSPFTAIQNWRTLAPIKVLDHPVSNLKLLVPNGMDLNTSRGFVSVSINLPLLMLQYRCFRLENIEKESQLDVQHFVRMYVLPNMLHSHTDITLLNRLINNFYEYDNDTNLKRYPFQLNDITTIADRSVKYTRSKIEDKPFTYYQVLKNIPSIYHSDMYSGLAMPSIAKTRQVWWAMLLTRLKVIKFLIDLGGEKQAYRNQVYIGKMKVEIRRLQQENIYRSILDYDMYENVEQVFNEIIYL